MSSTKKTVLIVGASQKEERYSNMAYHALKRHDYPVAMLANKKAAIGPDEIHDNLKDVLTQEDEIDTITVYLGPKNQGELIDWVDKTKAKRVIFNPGTENEALYSELDKRGVFHEEACTLVLLSSNQFER